MASDSGPSAEPTPPRWKHHVFLSFRGIDTRWGFLSHLHEALQNTGFIRTFKDDSVLQVGESISPSLIKAIQESMLAVVVLSENYASSPWCLDELTEIYKFMEGRDSVLPVFYKVDPADVRHQKNSFEVAFTKHRNSGRYEGKLGQWKVNLRKVANLSGWHSKNYENESVLVKRIVEVVCRRVKSTSNSAHGWKHDAFLSFSGEDTGLTGFVSKLYHEMNNRGIKSFRDERQMNAGLDFDPNFLMEIEDSRTAIIILSPMYASSTWCLEELTAICLRFKKDYKAVVPVFFNVEPSDARYQRGSFEIPFARHEEKCRVEKNTEKVEQWRVALKHVANISGWPFQDQDAKDVRRENKFIKFIVDWIVDQTRPICPLSTIDFEEFQATTQAMEEVFKALKDDEVRIIGVYGMGGVGKTTLLKYIAAQAVKNGIFDYAAMVVVSQAPDWTNIHKKLADIFDLNLSLYKSYGRDSSAYKVFVAAICRRTRSRRTLIILDDVWKIKDLSFIDDLHSVGFSKPSKVLFSTRIWDDVYNRMGTEVTRVTLNVLSEEDSWKFFVKKLGWSSNKSTSFYDAGIAGLKVLKDCGGLPIALKAAARLLIDKDLDEWNKGALREKAFQTDVLKSIKSSYYYLRHDAKLFFLLCCLFPEDDDIQITDLVKYGMSIGLFDNATTFKEARERAYMAVNQLKAYSLLLWGRKKGFVRLHNVIRSVAISTALLESYHGLLVKAGTGLEEWPMDACKEYFAISLMRNGIHKLPKILVSSKLKILLLQKNAGICEIPETFFHGQDKLRVIDLSSTGISLLPQSFSLLTNLKALYLDYCKYITETSLKLIAKLNRLQILSMRELPVKEFPRELGQLFDLRMLDITGAHIETVPSQVISRLHKLEELYMQCNFWDWWSRDGSLRKTVAGFEEVTGLASLNILKVSISDAKCLAINVMLNSEWGMFDICINKDRSDGASNLEHDFPHHHSRALTLDTSICTLPDWFINVVTERAETLRYVECKGLTNILKENEHGRLVNLKFLAVVGRHKRLKKLMNATGYSDEQPAVFKNLEELHLIGLHCLEELCVGELPHGSLRNVNLLNVRRCSGLGFALIRRNLLQRLHNLEKLICGELDQMEYAFVSEELDPEQVTSTTLRQMILFKLKKLVNIWGNPASPVIFQNLTVLVVYKCKRLQSLFTTDIAECLLQLEDLWVEDCRSLKRIIEASQKAEKKLVGFVKLKNLVVMDLPELMWIYTRHADIECPALEHLHIEDCPQLLTPASAFHSKNQVQVNDVQHWWSLKKRLFKEVEESL